MLCPPLAAHSSPHRTSGAVEPNTGSNVIGTSKPSSLPPSSMTLTFGQEDAAKMMEASAAFNQVLREYRAKRRSSDDRAGDSDHDLANAVHKDQSGDDNLSNDARSDDKVNSITDSEQSKDTESNKSTAETNAVVQDLIEAASQCRHSLVQAFLNALKRRNRSTAEIQACLVLFLDMDKSTKLLTAFGIFHEEENQRAFSSSALVKVEDDKDFAVVSKDDGSAMDTSGEASQSLAKPKTEATSDMEVAPTPAIIPKDAPLGDAPSTGTSDMRLSEQGLKTLFECFLTEISMCIRDQRQRTTDSSFVSSDETSLDSKIHNNTSDNDKGEAPILCDLSISKETEIRDIATYAADQLAKHVQKKNNFSSNDSHQSLPRTQITFEDFGEWYNVGGFELVPWLELLALSKWDYAGRAASKPGKTTSPPPAVTSPGSRSPPPMLSAAVSASPRTSKCVVSFDFTGAMPYDKPLHIDITEENLLMLKSVVTRTGLFRRSPQEMCEVILRHSSYAPYGMHRPPGVPGASQNLGPALNKTEFGRCMRELVPPGAKLVQEEIVNFSNFLVGLFSCFDRQGNNMVNAKELAAGFSFLSGGNKSNKLAIAFELLDEHQEGRLSSENLKRFLRSFLAVIVGISMPTSKLSREDMFHAVDNGAIWTQSHVLNSVHVKDKSYVTFDEFAEWYTEGGYTVAPWLELLDLSKFISLLEADSPSSASSSSSHAGGSSGFSSHSNPNSAQSKHSYSSVHQHPPNDVLFTFPLANDHDLVVLKDDVSYVRSVVDQLGLIIVGPEDVWSALCKNAASCYNWSAGGYEVDQNTFVNALDNTVFTLTGRRLDGKVKSILPNFFSSYDLEQCNQVPLSQLMGGLALFCLGRKSAKLAFSFGLFDGRNSGNGSNDPSKKGEAGAALNGEELFLFLRSFLIVLFSCCAQSLELTADGVSLWIHDTSKMVCENVMRFQWNAGKRCVNFDDFGIWYNQGGFEIAPWLELLDLNKWVLGQRPSQPHDKPHNSTRFSTAISADSDLHAPIMDSPMADFPYDAFAGDFEHIMSHDEKENCANPINAASTAGHHDDSSLTFQLLTNDEHQGVLVSITQDRVTSLRQLLTESGFYRMETTRFCSRLIDYSDKASRALSKDQYDNAMRSIVAESGVSMPTETQQRLSDLLTALFYAFDREKRAQVDAVELAAGMTVLCGGRKSDKLEYAFELIDDDRDGKLSRQGLWRFLRSFLTVLVSLSSAKNNVMKDERTISAVDNGASWAVSQAFGPDSNSRLISFDDFAAWYTKGGYGIIPWLELLDLRKWVIFP